MMPRPISGVFTTEAAHVVGTDRAAREILLSVTVNRHVLSAEIFVQMDLLFAGKADTLDRVKGENSVERLVDGDQPLRRPET